MARSTRALGHALIELIQERDYREITVQHILDRAGVGRATFYAHYRNKDDALHSSYERLFGGLEAMLGRPGTGTPPRLFPVAAFLEHIAGARELADALHRAGRLAEFWQLFTGHAARLIEKRIAMWPGVTTAMNPALAARMLAGALMESIEWWRDRQKEATPHEMETAFHELAGGVLRRACAP